MTTPTCCSVTNVDVKTISVETQVQPSPPCCSVTNVDVKTISVETQDQPSPPVTVTIGVQGPPGPPTAIEYAPDTHIRNKSDSDLLLWNESTQKWENRQPTSISGASGTSGASGVSGYSGTSGTSGYSGLGLSGYSGTSGVSGYSGTSGYRDWETDRKSTRLNSSHSAKSRMPSSA